MAILFHFLNGLLTIGSIVCFVLVLIQMFKRGQPGLGWVCIVGIFCCGIGPLVAFIYGWVKSQEWGLFNVMLAWTGIIVLSFVLGGIGLAIGAFEMPKIGQ